jgi:serine/threonine protein kinase
LSKLILSIVASYRLAPIRFADQITLEEKIGAGGYGLVYRGKWREDEIAVKIFLSSAEPSWLRETDLYQTHCLNHDNILRYIASDNIVNIPLRLLLHLTF